MLDNATYTKYLDEARASAMARLGDSPVYNTESENEQLRRSLLDQINNRQKFSYNINEDGLYNVYRDKYVNQGRMAMRDTMGQAAALTGGYGNSYGQAVGQQAYDRALQSLNDVVPQLYGQALNVYEMEGNQLQNRYGMANELVSEDYNRYRAQMSDWLTNKEIAEQQAQAAAQQRYQMEQDAYKNLTALIGSTGYVPSDAELAAAGMSQEAAVALYKEYLRQTGQLKTGGGGGGGGSGGKKSGGSGGGSGSGGTEDYMKLVNTAYKSGVSTQDLFKAVAADLKSGNAAAKATGYTNQYNLIKAATGFDLKKQAQTQAKASGGGGSSAGKGSGTKVTKATGGGGKVKAMTK